MNPRRVMRGKENWDCDAEFREQCEPGPLSVVNHKNNRGQTTNNGLLFKKKPLPTRLAAGRC